MSNGVSSASQLMAHLSYQESVTRLMRSISSVPEKDAIDKIISFRRLWRMPCPDTGDPRDYLIALHRARLRWPAMDMHEQNWSAHWLLRQGYSTDVDTVFVPTPAPPESPR